MPIIFEKQINPAKKLAVWHITEPLDFFLEQLNQKADKRLSTKRQLENAVSSVLLNKLGENGWHLLLERDNYGKPFLRQLSTSISFSHSKEMVACIVDTSGQVTGIDIEQWRDRITRISSKFINKEDRTPFLDVLNCHLIWGAKEVLYKIYAKKELDFICHLTVIFDETFMGYIHKDEIKSEYRLDFTELNNFIVVWNI